MLTLSTEGTMQDGARTTLGNIAHGHLPAIAWGPAPPWMFISGTLPRHRVNLADPLNIKNIAICTEPDIVEMFSSTSVMLGLTGCAALFQRNTDITGGTHGRHQKRTRSRSRQGFAGDSLSSSGRC